MDTASLLELIPSCMGEIVAQAFEGCAVNRGKVRDIIDTGRELFIVTTDRISAFDRVLTTIPCKGEVLNTISLFWFENTAHIVKNHIKEQVTARTVRTERCSVVPIEVVVRGYLTGSAWRDYQSSGTVSGIRLPAGMRAQEKFPQPLITPSTKAEQGVHDAPVSRQEIISSGLVPRATWEHIEEAALALFARGTSLAAERGLILVDTKYEFGQKDGALYLIDEVHTPDSSRYWYADTYAELFQRGEKQRELDKEYLRQWLLSRGWKGDGPAPEIPNAVRAEVAWKYVTAWETVTAKSFVPNTLSADQEARRVAAAIAPRPSQGLLLS